MFGSIGRRSVGGVLSVSLACAACGGGSSDSNDPAELPAVQEGVRIDLDTGVVVGEDAGDLRVFRGIPYVAPALGQLRFRPPEPHPGWSEPLETREFGPGCPQRGINPLTPVERTDEDCLTVNVWAHQDQELRPVMVWIHGGGYVGGASSTFLFEGSTLAREGVVVVSLNYRLGVLGFLADEALLGESDDGALGNQGILDQVAALEWLQRNIVAFGGDPNNVTLFGESAGASSICIHLGMPASEGLFHRAILQSGGGCFELPRLEGGNPLLGDPKAIGAEFFERSGCASSDDPLACARALEVERVLDIQEQLPDNGLGLGALGPFVDGVNIVGDGYSRTASGDAVDVPVITGSNRDELELFLFGGQIAAETAEDYQAFIRTLTADPTKRQVLAELYPLADYDSPRDAIEAMGTDVVFTCSSLLFAEAAGSGEPAFAYHFRGAFGGIGAAVESGHGLEIPFVFGNLEGTSLFTSDDADRSLSAEMRGLWASFARTGSPGGDPAWKPYAEQAPAIYTLSEAGSGLTTTVRDGRCQQLKERDVLP